MSSVKWFAGMIGGTVSAFTNIDTNQSGDVDTGEIINAIQKVIGEALDDLPQGLSIKKVIEEAKDSVLRAEAKEEFVAKFDLKNDKLEKILELVFELILEVLSIDRVETEAV